MDGFSLSHVLFLVFYNILLIFLKIHFLNGKRSNGHNGHVMAGSLHIQSETATSAKGFSLVTAPGKILRRVPSARRLERVG